MTLNNYKTIEFHTIEGRFKLFLYGSHLRIQDIDKSLKLNRMIWNECYRIDTTGCLKGYLSSFTESFAFVLSEYKTLKQSKDFIESKFLIG